MPDADDTGPSRGNSTVGSALGLAQEALGELGSVVPRLIDRGRRQADFVLAVVERLRCGDDTTADETDAAGRNAPGPEEHGPDGDAPVLEVVPTPPIVEPVGAPPSSTLAIPDYDALAASQVLPRLAGLAPEELAAIRDYEAAHRNRRTVLGRLAQLLG